MRKISSSGVDEGNLISNLGGASGIALDSQGDLYLSILGRFASDGQDKIVEYSPSGAFLRTVTTSGLDYPISLAFGPDGNLYVSNFNNNTITEYSPSGTYLGVFTSTGIDGPQELVFGASVPEPSSGVLLITAALAAPGYWAARRRGTRGDGR